MYSFDEVKQALDTGSLTEVLSKLEQFALSNKHSKLSEWASLELNGYPRFDSFQKRGLSETQAIQIAFENLPEYRREVVASVTQYNVKRINRVPIFIGVTELEIFEDGVMYPIEGVPYVVDESTRRSLLAKIRNETRRKLFSIHKSKPSVNIKAPAEIPSQAQSPKPSLLRSIINEMAISPVKVIVGLVTSLTGAIIFSYIGLKHPSKTIEPNTAPRYIPESKIQDDGLAKPVSPPAPEVQLPASPASPASTESFKPNPREHESNYSIQTKISTDEKKKKNKKQPLQARERNNRNAL